MAAKVATFLINYRSFFKIFFLFNHPYMANCSAVRDYYRPVQPVVRYSTRGVNYQEFIPAKELRPFIYCYWRLHTSQILAAPFNYRVVADGCIDIFWERTVPQQSFIMGFCKKYTVFPLNPTFDYYGIRFLPGMFSQLFPIPAKELSNNFFQLTEVLPNVADFIKNELSPSLSTVELQQFINAFFNQFIQSKTFDFDPRFYDALIHIMRKQGVVTTTDDLNTGISPRQLRRVFNQYIGTSPKTFSKVVRFQHILNAKPSTQSLRENRLFYDVGYYDQAHFIKDFKTLYGITPTEAFR